MSIRISARNLSFIASLAAIVVASVCGPAIAVSYTIPLTLTQFEAPMEHAIPTSLAGGFPSPNQTSWLASEPSPKNTKSTTTAANKPHTQLSKEWKPKLSRALSYRGVRYRWGGGSRLRGFDCSGFTRYLYLKEGIKLPHSVKLQFRLGKPVDSSDLRPGDLVFFNTAGPLSHVGIYIGDNKFLHAANTRRGVTVSSLSSAYYRQRYVGARRYKS